MVRERKSKPTSKQLAVKAGDKVKLLRDDGTFTDHEVRSEPWQLGHGEWVVLVTGITGGYQLTRVVPQGGVK